MLINTHNGKDVFTENFIHKVIMNHTYCGKIAYSKRKTVLKDGSEDEYHKIWASDYLVHERQHEALISEDLWEEAQAKAEANGDRKDTLDKNYQYIYSALLKCPVCGKSLYGLPRRRRKADGSFYPDLLLIWLPFKSSYKWYKM